MYQSNTDKRLHYKIDNNCHKSIVEIRRLLSHVEDSDLNKDDIVPCLRDTLAFLESIHKSSFNCGIEEIEIEPNDVMPQEVANWIRSTFSMSLNSSVDSSSGGLERFRYAANYIKTGLAVEKVMRPATAENEFGTNDKETIEYLKKNMDFWTVNMFELEDISGGKCLTSVMCWIMDEYKFLDKYRISEIIFRDFLVCLEMGYNEYGNPYHNSLHAADVVQTCCRLLQLSGLSSCLTNLETFSLIFAAMIHDFNHTGTTNLFHINTRSDLAILYNDKSVLENYHLSKVFTILQDSNLNIFQNFSADDYQLVRNLTIEMVLNTDMNLHSQQIKFIKTKLSLNQSIDKPKLLSLILHCADISHPTKEWDVHYKWTMRLLDEFFLQGDQERSFNLPISPLCDRNNILVNVSQIGFLDYIVLPTFEVIEKVLQTILITEETEKGEVSPMPWTCHMSDNKQKWQALTSNQK